MSAPYSTLLLDLSQWDLVLDSNGNIARADPPYAVAQDVASAIRTVLGEVWYDTTIGINYFGQILGKTPPKSLFEQAMVNAALTVPSVVSAQCIITGFVNRSVTGQVVFTTTSGQSLTVAIGT